MPKPNTPRRRARGPLYVVVGLFIASGVLRLGGEAEQVFANAESAPLAVDEPVSAPGDQCVESDTLITALAAREERVARRETQLADRLQALSVAEQEITNRLTELEEAEASLAATLAVAATAAEDDIGRLTDVYASMKPRDAAALFEEMAPEFASGFLSRMRPDAAAAIMTGLEPATAYSISVVIAGRNADVPTD
ncbi:MotE family protein [Octadecabacter sp. R77987]|uniref:MotE family protein n=1 Tax=Octadecabacter sp. R77987 TaxID=3093874 RepID=UPI00366F2B7F